MRHLLLALPLLAAGAVAAGCAAPCTAPALTISWRFDLADGTAGVGCAAAGVAKVSLWIDGQAAGLGMDCAQGAATFGGLKTGPHGFTVQGLSAAGAVLYQDWGTLSVDGCGETRVALRPGAGYLRIGYATSTGLCWAAGDGLQLQGFMWYLVQDQTTGQAVSIVNATNAPAALACQADPAQATITVPLPWGLYSLRWIQDVRDPVSASPVPVYQACTPLDVTLHAPGVTPLDVVLTPVTGPCTP